MKKYYQTLTKDKQKEIKEIYEEQYKSKDIYKRLKRLLWFGMAAIFCAVIILVLSFKYEKDHLTSILLAIILFISAVFFLLGRVFIKAKILNNIAIKTKGR